MRVRTPPELVRLVVEFMLKGVPPDCLHADSEVGRACWLLWDAMDGTAVTTENPVSPDADVP